MKFSPWRLLLVALGIAAAFLVYQYRQPRFIAGEKAPAFEVSLLNGQHAQLAELRGKYVLLQFWGSWCGPCRAENPYLAALYRQFQAKGFEIFSVAIESNPANWQRAIAADGMIWKYHTAEFEQFSGPVARLFNIHSIPTTFLINPDGRIMGVNWTPDQLEKTLTAALGSR